MAHATHFLERLERANAVQTDFALALYRDAESLHHILSNVRLPEGCERVAISLHPDDQGPYLVVDRAGGFITCLGHGMSITQLALVRYGQCMALYRAAQDLQSRRKQAHKLSRKEGFKDLVVRLLSQSANYSREEFVAVSALQPTMQIRLLKQALQLYAPIVEARVLFTRLRGPKHYPDLLRRFWDSYWGMGHLITLACMNGQRGMEEAIEILVDQERESGEVRATIISSLLSVDGEARLMIKGIWSAARIGKPLLTSYKASYRLSESYLKFVESLLVLLIMAARYDKLQPEIQKFLPTKKAWSPAILAAGGQSLEVAMKMAGMLLNDPDRMYELGLSYARDLTMCTLGRLRATPPYHFKNPNDIPPDLAWAWAADTPVGVDRDANGLLHLLYLAPWLARCEAHEMYLPRDLIRLFRTRWLPADTLRLIERWRAEASAAVRPAQSSTPGRNTLCACGSGKKYKHCCLREHHGGPAAPLAEDSSGPL